MNRSIRGALLLAMASLLLMPACGTGRNGGGGGGGNTPGGADIAALLFAANTDADNISAFAVQDDDPDSTTEVLGALLELDPATESVDVAPVKVVVDPDGNFLLALSQATDTVTKFDIDPTTGSIEDDEDDEEDVIETETGGENAADMVLSPNGSFLFVANRTSADISVFAVDGDGVLTAAPGSPFDNNSPATSIAISNTGNVLFVGSEGADQISVYSIDDEGVLTEINNSPFPTSENGPGAMVVDRTGSFLIVANTDDDSISTFEVAGNGDLGDETVTAVGSGLSGVAAHPDSNFVYVTSSGTDQLLPFALNTTTGALAATLGAASATGDFPEDVAISPDGRFLFVANAGDGTISSFLIDDGTGALTEVDGSPFDARDGTSSLAILQ